MALEFLSVTGRIIILLHRYDTIDVIFLETIYIFLSPWFVASIQDGASLFSEEKILSYITISKSIQIYIYSNKLHLEKYILQKKREIFFVQPSIKLLFPLVNIISASILSFSRNILLQL